MVRKLPQKRDFCKFALKQEAVTCTATWDIDIEQTFFIERRRKYFSKATLSFLVTPFLFKLVTLTALAQATHQNLSEKGRVQPVRL